MVKRIYRTWDEWECYPAGFYEPRPPAGLTDEEAREASRRFLSDDEAFRRGLDRVLAEWPNSCEHYLSNERMNRIAWLGQAAMCVTAGVSRNFRGGFSRLSDDEQKIANATALEYLNRWLVSQGEGPVDAEGAASKTQADMY